MNSGENTFLILRYLLTSFSFKMRVFLILPFCVLLTACSSIQLVQQEDAYKNKTLPLTTEHTAALSNADTEPENTTETESLTDNKALQDITADFRILQTWPLDQESDVALDKPIEVFFSKNVKENTINVENIFLSLEDSIRFYDDDPFKFIILNYDDRQRLLTINSGAYDLAGETIKVTLTDGVETVYNEPLDPYSFTFTLKPPEKLPEFRVVDTDPANDATYVTYAPDPGIRISYTNQVDQTTINDKSVIVTLPFSYTYSTSEPVSFNVRIDYAKQSSFLALDPEKTYRGEVINIKVTEGVKDTFGQPIEPYEFEFTVKQ